MLFKIKFTADNLLPLKVVKITLYILQITQDKEAFNLIIHNNTNYQEAPGDKLQH